MPPHQGRQGRVFTAVEVALEQLPIAEACPIPQEDCSAKVVNHLAHRACGHGGSFGVANVGTYLLLPEGRGIDTRFGQTLFTIHSPARSRR